jgi:D-xylose transport system permease protein
MSDVQSDSVDVAKTEPAEALDTATGQVIADEDIADAAVTAPTGGFADYTKSYLARVRGGDMGSLPAVGALVVLVIFFSIAEKGFWSLGNLANLVTQAAPSVLLAMGLVFVLLLGEIDLSAGVTSGVGAATTAVLLLHGWPWPLAVLVALAVGAVIGYLIGVMRAYVLVPSFVSTLALFLGLQGVVILIVNSAHTQGNITLNSNVLNDLENEPMPVWLGWVIAILCVAGFAASRLLTANVRRRSGLPAEPYSVIAAKTIGFAIVAFLFVYLLNQDRALNKAAGVKVVNGKLVQVKHTALQGVPWVVIVILVLVLVLGFILSRTRYGRHIYAVGGNDEAARRAGIRVNAIRISVFVICSTMAMVSGVVLASEIGVNNAEGGGNTLLLAVGAAVIGGTSLFGGKGKITDAVIGGLVVAVIINGMSDLLQGQNNAAYQAIVTGGVLLAASTVDALSRRRAGASGLA